ncbi:uncharacterized protein LOC143427612 [Xylocopa sonorina]|uniref:uncharacterized protein LOC143427612 n=1 Tax=Xylocopa sonorina TaxID=1818115 RepID=UPI00403B168F
MKLCHFGIAVIWIATVTATLESDSHGNWGNEKGHLEYSHGQEVSKNETIEDTKNVEDRASSQHERLFNSSKSNELVKEEREDAAVKFIDRNEENRQANETQQQFIKQVVQPYVLSLQDEQIPREISSESLGNISRPTRTSQSASNETITVQDSSTTAKYFLQESGFNDVSQTVSEENLDVENIGEFGQRVHPPYAFRQRNNDNAGRFRLRQPLNSTSPFEEQRRHHRKDFHSYISKKLNASDSSAVTFLKQRHSPALTRALESQRALKLKETEADHPDTSVSTKDVLTSTAASTTSVSLGKFLGPIVVPDLPRQNKYSYTTTPYYTEINETSEPTPASVESSKPKVSQNVYPAASSIALNPLQVGVALMNAGQDHNSVNEQVTLTEEYPQEDVGTLQVTDVDITRLIQNDAPDSLNSSFHGDQVSQQEQISEVVATNIPTQSVEIQKSIELYHTAPVQEIHYPVEFIPHVPQPLTKQRHQGEYRKPLRGQFKDQRPDQVSGYKINEIFDETIPSNNSNEASRYEYNVNENVNENDVVYAASSGQIDQTLAVARPVETKSVFGAKEQLNNAQYDQVVVKYSKPQEISEISIKQSEYELPKAQTLTATKPQRGNDGFPGLGNLENLQVSQEVPEFLLTKPVSESLSELRLPISPPQSYSAEKTVHAPHSVDVVEKKIPFPVEKVIEKQITIPQPFPVHVPIDRVVEKQIRIPYPVHIEKVIEKKVPFAIQRFIIPLPIHIRVPQPVPLPLEKVVEKPVPVPMPVEKIVEKIVHIPRPYSPEIEKNRPFSVESTKLVKSGPIYNVQADGNYQQVIRQNFQAPLAPAYGAENEQNYYNTTTQFYGPSYLALNRPSVRQPSIHSLPKKFGSYGIQYPHTITYSVNNGNLMAYGRASDKDKVKNEYIGPVPRKVQVSLGIQSKSLYSTPDIQATLRRTRQEAMVGNTGSFRQSKMEYGFKPPMVPSVQYDEQTATKVE